jgi:2-haloacid dehalogenase
MQGIGVCVFDAYGTLFDVSAAARDLAGEPGREAFAEVWQQVASDWRLAAYPEVPAMLSRLKSAGLATAILSNGSPDMLHGAVGSAGLGPMLDDVLSVEDVGIFKPARAVYDLVGKRFSCKPSDVLFVSSNGWDAASAASYGFRTLWVNRAGDPVDRLPGRPGHVARDLTGIPALLGID